MAHLGDHLRWPQPRVADVIRRAEQRGIVTQQGAAPVLTSHGRTLAGLMFGANG